MIINLYRSRRIWLFYLLINLFEQGKLFSIMGRKINRFLPLLSIFVTLWMCFRRAILWGMKLIYNSLLGCIKYSKNKALRLLSTKRLLLLGTLIWRFRVLICWLMGLKLKLISLLINLKKEELLKVKVLLIWKLRIEKSNKLNKHILLLSLSLLIFLLLLFYIYF